MNPVRDLLRKAEDLPLDSPETAVLQLITESEAAVAELKAAAKSIQKATEARVLEWMDANDTRDIYMCETPGEVGPNDVRWRAKPKTRVKVRDLPALVLDLYAVLGERLPEVLPKIMSASPGAWKLSTLRDVMAAELEDGAEVDIEDWWRRMFQETKIPAVAKGKPTKTQARTLRREPINFLPSQTRERIRAEIRRSYGMLESAE